MKLQVKLDKAAIQGFFLQHAEKIAFGAVAILFFWILYDAVAGKKTLEASQNPAKLSEKAASKSKEIDDAPVNLELQVPFSTETKHVRVREDLFASKVAYDPPLFERKPLRDKPPILAVEQLRGTAEVGAFRASARRIELATEAEAAEAAAAPPEKNARAKDTRAKRTAAKSRATAMYEDEEEMRGQMMMNRQAGGGAPMMPTGTVGFGKEAVGKRWISLVGLVPVEKQEEAYRKTFRDAVGYDPNSQSDQYPYYYDYGVERLEITSPGDVTDPDWSKAKAIRLKTLLYILSKDVEWSPISDVVSDKYTDPAFTFPLSQLLGYRFWGATVAHEPEIPLIQRLVTQPGMMRGPGMAPFDDDEGGFGSGAAPPGMTGGSGSGSPRGGYGARAPGYGARAPGAMPPGGIAGQIDEPDPFGGDGADPQREDAEKWAKIQEEQQELAMKPVEFRLFRFLDFNIETGKSYIYRVRLAVFNPNYQQKAVFLVDPNDSNKKYLVGDWSEPSPVITVPHDSRVLAKAVKSVSGVTTAMVVLTKWVAEKGIEAYTDPQPLYRGQVANIAKQAYPPPHSGEAHDGRAAGQAPTTPGMYGGGGAAGGSGSAAPRMSGYGQGGSVGGSGSAAPRGAGAGGSGSAPPGRSGAGRGAAAAKEPTNTIDVDYETDAVAVDFRGGGKLPGKKDVVTEPGEILLLDLNGNLVVRNEIEDALLIDEVMGVVEEADTPQADAAGGIRYGLDTIAPVSSKKGADKKKGAAKKTGNPRLDYSNP